MRPSELATRIYDRTCPDCGGNRVMEVACSRCSGTGLSERRCRECYTWKPIADFLHGGRAARRCHVCGDRVKGVGLQPLVRTGELRVILAISARNRKTGPIPVSITTPGSCPTSCPWMGNGCYAEQHFTGMHWRRLAKGGGMSWEAFCSEVVDLPRGQLWRHNEAGDLPGQGDQIDESLLRQLLGSAAHTRGFTYTHKPVLGNGSTAAANRTVIARANDGTGLTINLSADGLEDADRKAELGIGPVVAVVQPTNKPWIRTPAGHRVTICPAVYRDDSTCATCGLCQRQGRKSIVGFPVHGNLLRTMTEKLVQLRLFDS
jgi:hypothetical protein